MKLYFLRHGIAEDATGGMSDAQRALTPKGIERMEISAKMMAKLGVKPAHLYSSPLVRARQTAEIVGKAIDVKVEIDARVGLGFSVPVVGALIDGSSGDVMFVGHEPDMSEVVSALIGGGAITMKKGSLARLDVYAVNPLRCALVWLVAPAVFVADGEED